MKRKAPFRRRGAAEAEADRGVEWVGGRRVMPAYVTGKDEGDEPYRPEMVLWFELPDGFIVSTVLDHPERRTPFAHTLRDAMAKPLIGPPRRPDRIRVADPALADELAEVVSDIEIDVAPTPELDALVEEFVRYDDDDDGPELGFYLDDARLDPTLLANVFRAAATLFRAAPWKHASDEPIRMDVPSLGIEGACVSILGALGDVFGVTLFRSLTAFESFLAAAAAHRDDPDAPIHLGTSVLTLTFERGADFSPAHRRRVLERGWEIAGPNAYPEIQHREHDGVNRPISEQDLRTLKACAESLAIFTARNASYFSGKSSAPVSESIVGADGITVRLTAPYDAPASFEPPKPLASATPRSAQEPAAAPGPHVPRNAPCPCGSGKKYKLCHLPHDEASRRSQPADEPTEPKRWSMPRDSEIRAGLSPGAALHALDAELSLSILRFARERFPAESRELVAAWADDPVDGQLLAPLSLHHTPIGGEPVASQFLTERAAQLTSTEQAWLEAQRAAWLSVWEVRDVRPGKGLTVKDLLTEEIREVAEVSGSKGLSKREAVLGRVVVCERTAVFAGLHPRPLTPGYAAWVVDEARRRLRRKTAVPVARLRDDRFVQHLVELWEEAVEDMLEGASQPPRLSNTDGDDLLLTVDHFEVDPAFRREVLERIATLEEAEPVDREEGADVIRFVRHGRIGSSPLDSTLIGRVWAREGKLRIETNSVRRADRLRARVEAGCGEQIRFRTREHTDPTAPPVMERAKRAAGPPREVPPEADAVIRAFKEHHYADWADVPLPGLAGRTPREAVRSTAGRREVDLMLKDMERSESRQPEAQRYDIGLLRKQLGLRD